MAHEQLQWTAPAPLWTQAANATDIALRRDILRRPAILRFAKDTFMDDFMALMENDPASLPKFLAEPETWRGPAVDPEPVKSAPKFVRALNRLRLTNERHEREQASLINAQRGSIITQNGTMSRAGSSGTLPNSFGSSSVGTQIRRQLKLYQPAHQRYYLLAACLVCGRAGLPDHALQPARDERATFVLRRLFPPGVLNRHAALPAFDATTWEEYAFISTPHENGWRKVTPQTAAPVDVLLEGEEKLPLSAVNYDEEDGRRRRLLVGLIPVGKREVYMGASALTPEVENSAIPAQKNAEKPVDPRMMPLWLQVTEPWKRLIERADAVRKMQSSAVSPFSTDEPLPGDAQVKSIKVAREKAQTISWYILLDFADYLEEHLPDLWQVVLDQQPDSSLNSKPEQKAVLSALNTTALTSQLISALSSVTVYPESGISSPALYAAGSIKNSLRAALKAIRTFNTNPDARERLESVTGSYDRDKADPAQAGKPDPAWPTFLFPFADPINPGDTTHHGPLPFVSITALPNDSEVQKASKKIDKFSDLIEAALPVPAAPLKTPLPLAAQRVMDTREGWFIIRCVYERPECGPLDPPLLSAPTREFQLAGFFDPDAPARPIRIALPIDTTPAGLRKFDKNTAFMISDTLCGQIERMKGMTLGDLIRSVLPWPLHKDLSVPDSGPCAEGGLQLGMICSLSIPIITICALILLLMIVFILDIIFSWVPFLLICFPLPGFGAKKS